MLVSLTLRSRTSLRNTDFGPCICRPTIYWRRPEISVASMLKFSTGRVQRFDVLLCLFHPCYSITQTRITIQWRISWLFYVRSRENYHTRHQLCVCSVYLINCYDVKRDSLKVILLMWVHTAVCEEPIEQLKVGS